MCHCNPLQLRDQKLLFASVILPTSCKIQVENCTEKRVKRRIEGERKDSAEKQVERSLSDEEHRLDRDYSTRNNITGVDPQICSAQVVSAILRVQLLERMLSCKSNYLCFLKRVVNLNNI